MILVFIPDSSISASSFLCQSRQRSVCADLVKEATAGINYLLCGFDL